MDDDELGLGASVTLRDNFSQRSQRVREEFGRLYQSFRAGSTGMVQALGALAGQSSLVGFALGGPTGVAMGMHALIASSVESGARIENLSFAFTQLLGSTDAARQHLQELQDFAVGKPFEFEQLAVASRTLQVFGFNARESMGLIQTMGDAAFTAATGFEGVDRMIRVFGNVRSAGRITFGQLGMLVRAGVPAFDILKERLHLTDQQIQKIARSGIPAEQIITALREGMEARFAGGMTRAAQSLSARLSDLSDSMTIFRTQLYENIGPAILDVLDALKGSMSREAMGQIAKTLGDVLSTVVRLVRILFAPATGAFADLTARWERDGGRAVAPVRRFLANVRDVIEGVAALLTTEDTRGISHIPRALRDKLVERGLWPLAQRIARWGDRVRAFLTGFVAGFLEQTKVLGGLLRGLASALGIERWDMNRESAEKLGRALGRLVTSLVLVKGALLAVRAAGMLTMPVLRGLGPGRDPLTGQFVGRSPGAALAAMLRSVGSFAASVLPAIQSSLRAFQASLAGFAREAVRLAPHWRQIAQTLTSTAVERARLFALNLRLSARAITAASVEKFHLLARASARFALANPVLLAVALAVLAIGAASLWAYRHADKLASTAPKWRALRAVMDAVFGPLIEVAILLGRTDDAVGTLRARLVTFGRALWEALWPVRVAVSFVVLFTYVVVARVAMVVAGVQRLFVGMIVGLGRLAAFGARTFVTPFVEGWAYFRIGLGALVAYLRDVWTQVKLYFFQRFGEELNWLARKFAVVLTVLLPVWTVVRAYFETQLTALGAFARGFFANLTDTMLAPLRAVAREIVAAYRDLPAALRPSALGGMVGTLERFGAGPGSQTALAATQAAGAGASTGAPAVAAATAQASALQGAAARASGGAPVVVQTPPPPPVTAVTQVMLDGRQIAEAVTQHQQEDQMRRGGSVPTRRGPFE